jgi:hypothetical protein
MSTATPIDERTSIRRALRLLAGHHLREPVVVNQKSNPIGVFRDIEGSAGLDALRRLPEASLRDAVKPNR